ncbi:MAG: TPM domain-containing protein [Bacteroidales bacterium]|nr:TPM domain-containing protein [Bacteroidales bacterium]
MKARSFLSPQEIKDVVAAIVAAEKATSGEIRVHIEDRCGADPRIGALRAFRKLKMHKTAARNGVLVYVACVSHKFAVIGDEGINNVVPDDFWQDVVNAIGAAFSEGRFAEGISEGIHMIGEKLKAFFPYQSDDVNELPDDISFGSCDENQE